MMKDVRKTLLTFWSSQFLQGVIFEDFDQKHGFPGPLETILWQFTAQLHKAKIRLRAALATQSIFEFAVLQLVQCNSACTLCRGDSIAVVVAWCWGRQLKHVRWEHLMLHGRTHTSLLRDSGSAETRGAAGTAVLSWSIVLASLKALRRINIM